MPNANYRPPQPGDGWTETTERDWTELRSRVSKFAGWLARPAMTRADALALALILYGLHGAFHLRLPYAISLALVGGVYTYLHLTRDRRAIDEPTSAEGDGKDQQP